MYHTNKESSSKSRINVKDVQALGPAPKIDIEAEISRAKEKRADDLLKRVLYSLNLLNFRQKRDKDLEEYRKSANRYQGKFW